MTTGANNFKPFAVGGSANAITQSAYEALTTLIANGFLDGVADSAKVNKVLRQAAFGSAVLGEIIAANGVDALDDGDLAGFKTKLLNALNAALSITVPDASATVKGKVDLNTIRSIARTGYMLVRDEKPSGTNGGPSISGVQTRVLNTVVDNTITGATLSGNQITLPAGTYRVVGTAPSTGNNGARAYLYNVTDSSVAVLGRQGNTTASGVGDIVVVESGMRGRFAISEPKVFEVRHYTESAQVTYGLGSAVSNGGNEIYTEVEITKEP